MGFWVNGKLGNWFWWESEEVKLGDVGRSENNFLGKLVFCVWVILGMGEMGLGRKWYLEDGGILDFGKYLIGKNGNVGMVS